MQPPIGRKRWAIAEGYIPSWSQSPASVTTTHKTVCILNTTERYAHVELTGFYTNRAPGRLSHSIVPACRTKQVWLNDLAGPEPIPPAVDSASVIASDVLIVVQYLRLDSRLAEHALVSTIEYVSDEEG